MTTGNHSPLLVLDDKFDKHPRGCLWPCFELLLATRQIVFTSACNLASYLSSISKKPSKTLGSLVVSEALWSILIYQEKWVGLICIAYKSHKRLKSMRGSIYTPEGGDKK